VGALRFISLLVPCLVSKKSQHSIRAAQGRPAVSLTSIHADWTD
jgi:hypothetical protein